MTPSQRSQVNRLLLLVTTPGVALGSVMLATAFMLGAFDHETSTAAAACPRPVPVDLAGFEVSVLNGSGIPGQAAAAAKQLTRAGFRVAAIETASEWRWTDASAVISYGAQGREPAQRLAAHLPGAVQVPTHDAGRHLEVVLGTAFTGVSPTPSPAARPGCDA